MNQGSAEQLAAERREPATSRLNAIVDPGESAIATCGPAQRLTSWNQGAERIFGYAADEAIGLPITLLAPPELKGRFDRLLTRLQRGAQLHDFATRGLRRDGSSVEIRLTAAPIINAAGDRRGISFIVRDLSAECNARRRLEETGEWLRATLAHAPLLVTVTDANGIYTMVEGQALNALGLEHGKALLGRSALEPIGKDSPAAATTRQALAGETTAAMAEINGHQFEMWKTPLRNAQGRITGTLSVNTDVSLRVAIEQELQARLRQQETITALSKKALGRTPFADLARRTAGRAREALNVELAGVFVQKEPRAGFAALAVAAGASLGLEMEALSFPPVASLAAFAVNAGVPVISDELGRETRFIPHPQFLRVGFASAIAIAFGPHQGNWGVLAAYAKAPRRFTRDDAHFIEALANILTSAIANAEAELKLRRSEAYFRSLIEHTSDIITVIDRRGIIRFMGGAFEALFGYPPELTLGKPSISMLGPERRAEVAEATKYAFRHPGEVTRVEYRQRRADASWVDCEAFMKTVTDLGDETLLVVSMRDVSDRKRHEAAIAHARDVALEAVRLKTAFLTNMSHEVRTPVNIIMGYSDLVREYLNEQGDQSQAPFLEAMSRGGPPPVADHRRDYRLFQAEFGLPRADAPYDPARAAARTANEPSGQPTPRPKNLTLTCALEHPGAEVWLTNIA